MVVLSNTDKPVDAVGLRLLGIEKPDGENRSPVMTVVMILFAFSGLGLAWSAARNRGADRLSVTGRGLWALLLLWVARNAGPWNGVPPVAWLAGAGVLAAAIALAVLRWPGLATGRTPVPWRSWISVALPLVLLIAFGVAVAL
ncbi:hypothetical protein [Nonomuraea sp. B19D2]|uniref:hypothetical protein n=1 Tax=Nonomuraea sp. B19D2 TaxID=3159561 RepID=UPI0032DBE5B6